MDNKVIYMSLPATVKAFTVLDGEDFCTIVLNKNLSHEQNVQSYRHEMEHIGRNDFQKTDVDIVEGIRHE